MFNWLTGNRDRIAELTKQQAELAESMAKMQQSFDSQLREQQEKAAALVEAANETIEKQEAELTTFRTQAEEHRALREGNDPWVEIVGSDYTASKGIEIKLDWNDAFVKYLRDNGFEAKEDEQVVQKWLLCLYRDVAVDMDERAVENTDFHQPNEYM